MSYAVGSLVKARGREWVVLPDSEQDLLVLRPLGGTDDEIAGILTALETIEPASFAPPDPTDLGDFRSCRLLRDALRLTFRSSAGPFRSFGRIAVEPRPYQLVPLLMALKLDPVRLLIADDVGIGKTVEALLVARELIDQGEVQRLAVLCPPHLAEQWQAEMRDKFHLEAELVLAGTAARLERGLAIGESLFERHPITVVSMDYIKSDKHLETFLHAAPELVIVDEAHTCTDASAGRGGRHQRHRLVNGLATVETRNLILVTATPHSGKEEAFRTLIGFLDPSFRELPDDLSSDERARERRRLARQMVQRRRGDIEHYLGDTPFPRREMAEATYTLTSEYRALFEKVLAYARETIADPSAGGAHRQRVRWWAVLGLLRSLASSPAAAAATLRNRARSADTVTVEEADEVGRRDVLDLIDDESAEGMDVIPGADAEEGEDPELPNRRRLNALAREAEALEGDGDPKLKQGIALVKDLVADDYNPIVFCRFIPTAHYLAGALRTKLRGVEVEAVTGELPPSEREERVLVLGEAPKRVLVATDCLSEGINLQEHFDAVVHYDLSWNPTRHEQREGRVDRYNQQSEIVRVLTYFGSDNRIDGIVLDVLLRKHRAIRDSLGISVPVPDSNAVLEAIMEGLILRGRDDQLSLFEEPELEAQCEVFHGEWEVAAEREKRSRTVFAQETIKVGEVERELLETRAAVGSGADVKRFTEEALRAEGAVVTDGDVAGFDLSETPRSLRDLLGVGEETTLRAGFDLPVKDGVAYLSRTHPLVEGLASHVVDTALDPQLTGVANRAGATRPRAVSTRSTLLLARLRFDVVTRAGDDERRQIAEETRLLAFEGAPERAVWLDEDAATTLLDATPDGNVTREQAVDLVRSTINTLGALDHHLAELATMRGEALLDAHRRVRRGTEGGRRSYSVEPQLPMDVLGVYVLLPVVDA
jgi:superfamily II DNA or RNA helicase